MSIKISLVSKPARRLPVRYLLITTYLDHNGAAIGFSHQALDVWAMDMHLWFAPQVKRRKGVFSVNGLACVNRNYPDPSGWVRIEKYMIFASDRTDLN